MKVYNVNGDRWKHGKKVSWNSHSHYLGPCPVCGKRTFEYGGGYRCVGLYCSKSSSNPVGSVGKMPSWWNTNINVNMDGNAWHAFYDDFENLVESVSGFGDTPQKAVNKLLEESK